MQIRNQLNVHLSQPRDDVRVTMPDGTVLQAAPGTTVEAFLQAHRDHTPDSYDSEIMGAICDDRLRELAYPIEQDTRIEPVLLSSSDGGRIYRRSLVLLLVTAFGELWPDASVSVRYAVPDGGFYCTALDRPPLTADEIARLEAQMRTIVERDESITKRTMPLDEVRDIFRNRGDYDKLRLLEQRTRADLVMYTLRNRADYYYGYMLPSTGYLRVFRLIPVEDGFVLQYPRKETPDQLREIRAYDKLSAVFHETDQWLRRMGVEDIGRLNRVSTTNRIQELILVAEALHEQNIARIANAIRKQHERGVRIVMIAGPSSAGKTTFAKRLAIQLLAHGIRPFTLELDNYFVDREQTPRDEQGEYDFEALDAINLELFNRQLNKLIAGETVTLPRFDFFTGTSHAGREAQLKEGQIIIVEGIHGLNPELVAQVPEDMVYRVYVSALTQLNVDSHNRVPTTDVRLLRRIVRDAQHRGYTATDTLQRWQSVRRGEKRNIFPYQENADIMFNSALVYELAALRPHAEPLLLQVQTDTPPHLEANRLLSFLSWVKPLSPRQEVAIPDTSLLREFIGGSSLREYHPADFRSEFDDR